VKSESLNSNPYKQYCVLARQNPSKNNKDPVVYRMKIFAKNTVVAKSRVWYFLNHMKKVKKANGQIIGVYRVPEDVGENVKNYGVWIRYVSRSGIHNMYREYRDTCLSGAVHQMYQEMASRHRARFSTIHVIKAVEVPAEKCKRSNTLQFLKPDLKFPKVGKIEKRRKKFATTFQFTKPNTHYDQNASPAIPSHYLRSHYGRFHTWTRSKKHYREFRYYLRWFESKTNQTNIILDIER